MSAATLTENPCMSAAWLGYKIKPANGEVLWTVCAWCPPVVRTPVEREAERLCIAVSHGICPSCAEKMRGDTLPGIISEQP